jgi:hypothetical protein
MVEPSPTTAAKTAEQVPKYFPPMRTTRSNLNDEEEEQESVLLDFTGFFIDFFDNKRRKLKFKNNRFKFNKT